MMLCVHHEAHEEGSVFSMNFISLPGFYLRALRVLRGKRFRGRSRLRATALRLSHNLGAIDSDPGYAAFVRFVVDPL